MSKLTLTELEAIKLTIGYGYDGEELQSAKFKKLGCLDGQRDKITGEFKNRAMIKFIRKLETIYEQVEVEGKGKKRQYTLSNKRDVMTQIQDDRVNNGLTQDDFVMAKHFYNMLSHINLENPRSYYQWATDTGAINPTLLKSDDVKSLSDSYYYGYDVGEIYKGFNKYIKNRNRQIGSNCINWLRRNEYIRTIEHHYAVDLHNQTHKINSDTYENFNEALNGILERYELSKFIYEEILSAKEINEKYIGAIEEINDLYEQFNLKKVWIAIQIVKLKDNQFEVTRQDYIQAYYNKMMYSLENPKRKRKVKEDSYNDVFFVFNIAYLLKQSFKVSHKKIEQYIENHIPEKFAIDMVLINKPLEENEKGKFIKSSFGDNVEDKPQEYALENDTFNINTMTIDDLIEDIVLEEKELEPYIATETYKYIPTDNIHNNKNLASAMDMIKIAFSKPVSQPIAVGSF